MCSSSGTVERTACIDSSSWHAAPKTSLLLICNMLICVHLLSTHLHVAHCTLAHVRTVIVGPGSMTAVFRPLGRAGWLIRLGLASTVPPMKPQSVGAPTAPSWEGSRCRPCSQTHPHLATGHSSAWEAAQSCLTPHPFCPLAPGPILPYSSHWCLTE